MELLAAPRPRRKSALRRKGEDVGRTTEGFRKHDHLTGNDPRNKFNICIKKGVICPSLPGGEEREEETNMEPS